MDFAALGADIAVEAQQALMLTEQLEHPQRPPDRQLYRQADPDQIVTPPPASARSWPRRSPAGWGPAPLHQPGRGPLLLRAGAQGQPVRPSRARRRDHQSRRPDRCAQAACMAADMARRTDPQLAAKYVRLMNAGRHHDSAVCHVATVLLTRIAACLRTGQPYVIRDLDGTATDRSRRAAHRHRAPPGRPQDPRQERQHPQVQAAQAQDEPGVTEVAERSNIPARHPPAYEPPRGLTSLRNSIPDASRYPWRCAGPRQTNRIGPAARGVPSTNTYPGALTVG